MSSSSGGEGTSCRSWPQMTVPKRKRNDDSRNVRIPGSHNYGRKG